MFKRLGCTTKDQPCQSFLALDGAKKQIGLVTGTGVGLSHPAGLLMHNSWHKEANPGYQQSILQLLSVQVSL